MQAMLLEAFKNVKDQGRAEGWEECWEELCKHSPSSGTSGRRPSGKRSSDKRSSDKHSSGIKKRHNQKQTQKKLCNHRLDNGDLCSNYVQHGNRLKCHWHGTGK